MSKNLQTAVLGGGCFWCAEAVFDNIRGVVSVMPGYAGGLVENPTYEQVSSGKTGHAEVVKIDFDPELKSTAKAMISESNTDQSFFTQTRNRKIRRKILSRN